VRPTVLTAFPALGPFVDAEWVAHVGDDFADLARTPSNCIVAYCDVFRADRALFTLDTLRGFAHGTLPDAVDERIGALWRSASERRPAMAIVHRKAMLKEALRMAPDPALREKAAAALAALDGVDTPKAADLRAAMKPIVERLFGRPLASSGTGDWVVPFEVGLQPMELRVDTGGMSRGFRYFVRQRVPGGLAASAGLSYESALGFADFPFEQLRTDRLDEQLGQWATRLERLVAALGTDSAP
jgi:hypothetical protein